MKAHLTYAIALKVAEKYDEARAHLADYMQEGRLLHGNPAAERFATQWKEISQKIPVAAAPIDGTNTTNLIAQTNKYMDLDQFGIARGGIRKALTVPGMTRNDRMRASCLMATTYVREFERTGNGAILNAGIDYLQRETLPIGILFGNEPALNLLSQALALKGQNGTAPLRQDPQSAAPAALTAQP
jgi:hypothetical protein